MESTMMDSTTEEQDLLNRSVDRPKTAEIPATQSVWQRTGGAEIVRGRICPTSIYIGDETDNEHIEYKDVEEMGPETDEDAIFISREDCYTLWRPWRKAIIIKLLGKPITYNYLCKRLLELWKHREPIEVTDLEYGYYVVRFSNADDYHVALENGPWIIMGHYLNVMKWKPFFQPELEKITKTMAWVRVVGLSMEIFDQALLEKMGSILGRIVKIDPNTEKTIRGKFARICVELDLSKRLKPAIVVNGRKFKVEYEGLHQICFACGKFGHNKDVCPDVVREQTEGAEINAQPGRQEPRQVGPTQDNPYGIWMIADRRRNWTTHKPKNPHGTNHLPPNNRTVQGDNGRGKSTMAPDNNVSSTDNRFAALNGLDDEMEEEGRDEVEALRNNVMEVESHGGEPEIREFRKQGSSNHGSKKRNNPEPSKNKQQPGNKNPKTVADATPTHNDTGKNKNVTGGRTTKKITEGNHGNGNKSGSRSALSELPNGNRVEQGLGHPATSTSAAANKPRPNSIQGGGEHTKQHPPDHSREVPGNNANTKIYEENPLFNSSGGSTNPQ